MDGFAGEVEGDIEIGVERLDGPVIRERVGVAEGGGGGGHDWFSVGGLRGEGVVRVGERGVVAVGAAGAGKVQAGGGCSGWAVTGERVAAEGG